MQDEVETSMYDAGVGTCSYYFDIINLVHALLFIV